MSSSDIAFLFTKPDPDRVRFRQGTIVSWDSSTGDNVVQVGGAQLTNLPFEIAASAVLQPGDVVNLHTAGGKWYISGKVTDPGESSVVPQWTGDIANLNDVVVPELTTNIATAQTTADTAQTTADGAATDAATAIATANSAASDAADALAAATTDGNPPASSPAAEVVGGLEILLVRWTPITNADPVTYQVHVSTEDDFTPDSSTLAGTTTASQFTIKALPGDPPADPDEDDPRVLMYDTTYYVKIIATDADGEADPGDQGSAIIFQITGENLAADSVTAASIAAGTITGDLLSASMVVSGNIKTGEEGQRVELGTDGLKAFKSDDSVMISLPTAEGEDALLDAEVIARGLTVVGGASFQSTQNEITADASMTLMRGISSPSATPQVGVAYDTVQISTESLTNANKTGSLGTFDLVPSEVYCIEWKDFSPDYWVIHQIRPGGTRAWFFRVDTGAPFDIGSSTYFTDYVNWAVYSVIEITDSSTPSKNGVYRMARWLPSGSANQYYLWSPFGLNKYSRSNGLAAPGIGTNGDDVFVAETTATDGLTIRYYAPNGDGGTMTATSTISASAGYHHQLGVSTVMYDPGAFGVPSAGLARYATVERGVGNKIRLLYVSGGALWPGGSGNSWAAADQDAESFESPTSNTRSIAYDYSNSCFWSFAADGFMYKHTNEMWDSNDTSSTYWAKVTFYDSDSTGGTHETTPGPVKSYVAKRRAKNYFTAPSIPDNGGTNDPDRVRLYMARGDTAPANSSYHLQYTGTTSTTWTTMATATANPPTSNNFPSATPAKIVNADETLEISGDGTIEAAGVTVGGESVIHTGNVVSQVWTNLPLVNSWASQNGRTAQYMKDATGRVQLRGQIAGGASNGALTIASLPSGFRPTQTMEWTMRSVNGIIVCAIQVSTTGAITAVGNASTVSSTGANLDGISFPTN